MLLFLRGLFCRRLLLLQLLLLLGVFLLQLLSLLLMLLLDLPFLGLVGILFCELLMFLFLLLLKLLPFFLLLRIHLFLLFLVFLVLLRIPRVGRSWALDRRKFVGMHRGRATGVVVPAQCIASPRIAGTPMNRASLAGGNDSTLVEGGGPRSGRDRRLAVIYGSS